VKLIALAVLAVVEVVATLPLRLYLALRGGKDDRGD
jgi:hypothetical protein